MYWFKACSPEASTLSCPGFCSNCHHLVGCQLWHESEHRQLNGHHFYSHPLNVALQIAQHLCSFTPYSHEVLTIVSSVSCIPLTQERNFNRVSYAMYCTLPKVWMLQLSFAKLYRGYVNSAHPTQHGVILYLSFHLKNIFWSQQPHLSLLSLQLLLLLALWCWSGKTGTKCCG